MEYKGMNRMLHFIIGVALLLFALFLHLGLRPIFLLASLALGIFLVDYSVLPFISLYQAFMQWLPLLFELNILNGVLISTRVLHFSKFWSIVFIGICVVRSLMVVYCRHLPIDDKHRVRIEGKLHSFSKLFLGESEKLYLRLRQLFCQTDEPELSKFQLEQMHSADHPLPEHDETIHRFQQIAHDLSSPVVSSIECSHQSTPPTRRHHHRILQQSELEPLSRTPITPAHNNLPHGKILHSTMNGSYTGPMTRIRTKTGGSSSITTSPLKGKTPTEMTFLICTKDENAPRPLAK